MFLTETAVAGQSGIEGGACVIIFLDESCGFEF